MQHTFPIHPSSLSRWRKRLQESGCELLLKEMINVGLKTETIKKAVSYPTDAKLYHRSRERLVTLAQEHNLSLRQPYTRVSKHALFKANRYFAAQQMKRGKKQVKKVKTYLGCVYRDILRQLDKEPSLKPIFTESLEIAKRLLQQQKGDKNKLYSCHAPEWDVLLKVRQISAMNLG